MAGFSILALARHILVGMLGMDDHEFGVSAGRLAGRPRERGARGDVFDAHDNPMVLSGEVANRYEDDRAHCVAKDLVGDRAEPPRTQQQMAGGPDHQQITARAFCREPSLGRSPHDREGELGLPRRVMSRLGLQEPLGHLVHGPRIREQPVDRGRVVRLIPTGEDLQGPPTMQ